LHWRPHEESSATGLRHRGLPATHASQASPTGSRRGGRAHEGLALLRRRGHGRELGRRRERLLGILLREGGQRGEPLGGDHRQPGLRREHVLNAPQRADGTVVDRLRVRPHGHVQPVPEGFDHGAPRRAARREDHFPRAHGWGYRRWGTVLQSPPGGRLQRRLPLASVLQRPAQARHRHPARHRAHGTPRGRYLRRRRQQGCVWLLHRRLLWDRQQRGRQPGRRHPPGRRRGVPRARRGFLVGRLRRRWLVRAGEAGAGLRAQRDAVAHACGADAGAHGCAHDLPLRVRRGAQRLRSGCGPPRQGLGLRWALLRVPGWNCADVRLVVGGGASAGPTPAPSPTEPTSPTEPPETPEPEPEPEPEGSKQLVAFVENWLPCPSLDKIRGYDKVIVSFAVSYTWNPTKNQCDQSCTIGVPATCDNQAKPDLIETWRQAGTKVLLSFGGAGMGGSWAGDVNDCWEYCFGRVDSVVSRLVEIIDSQGFDGVDMWLPAYDHTDTSSQFLKDLTTGLRAALPPGKIISHAPMDGDIAAGAPYFRVLQEVASSVDYLLPQYYNGPLRPAIDTQPAIEHMGHLVDDIFGGDASKVVFGFCIADCSGTGSNVDGSQAAAILQDVAAAFPGHGGAFLWAASDDVGWSEPVRQALGSAPSVTPLPTPAVPTPAPTEAPTTSPSASGGEPSVCEAAVAHHGKAWDFAGPCSACLAGNNVCYDDPEHDSQSLCSQWPENVWCGEASLVESRRSRRRPHAFLGTALLQTVCPLSRASPSEVLGA
ncbi:unnamed protein product, partial [Prorocentrum cordatum]